MMHQLLKYCLGSPLNSISLKSTISKLEVSKILNLNSLILVQLTELKFLNDLIGTKISNVFSSNWTILFSFKSIEIFLGLPK